jgi:hypothetical protein
MADNIKYSEAFKRQVGDDLTPCATWLCGRCEFCG